jgi:antitoxin (DNA-binding transcriptional repressor) of toxin-antitoxin stability system
MELAASTDAALLAGLGEDRLAELRARGAALEAGGRLGSEHLSHPCYSLRMARQITQRELRNESGAIMRELDRGESFVVTRNGVPVGELHPIRRQRFVAASVAVAALASAGSLDSERFRADVDRVLDQGAAPRA